MTAQLAIAADGPYVAHSLVTLRSVLAHTQGLDPVVHFLHGDDLADESAAALAEAASAGGGRLVFHRIDDRSIEGLPTYRWMTGANYYRFMLPELLPDTDRVLYIDIDAVAADDLAPIFATDIDDAYVAAVDDVLSEQWRPKNRVVLPDGQRYFNAGVMLLNLEAIRADGISAQLVAHARFMGQEAWRANQDSINAVLGVRRVALAPRWNVLTGMLMFPHLCAGVFGERAFAEAQRKPGIRHFEGRAKPWVAELNVPGRDLYLAHR